MRVAIRTLLIPLTLAAASACRQSPPEQNIALENSAAGTTEIEALPPDESVATPTNELASGDDEASNVSEPANAD
jgi:hypothetical protein